MPSDLIYREDAKDYARHAIKKGLDVLEYLDDVPAADARPVVRGKWKQGVCQTCFFDWSVVAPFASAPNFCPNCGADMRKKDKMMKKVVMTDAWKCETCVHYPPSSCDGKPCTQCDPDNVYFNCYLKKEEGK